MLIALKFKGFFRLFDPTNPWMDVARTTQEQLSRITHTVKGKCSKKPINIKQEAPVVGFK